MAVTQNGLSLKYASDKLRNNKDVVINAVSSNGLSIGYVSKELR
jgi:hypothetical protein